MSIRESITVIPAPNNALGLELNAPVQVVQPENASLQPVEAGQRDVSILYSDIESFDRLLMHISLQPNNAAMIPPEHQPYESNVAGIDFVSLSTCLVGFSSHAIF